MKIRVEQYAKKIDVDGSIANLMKEKEIKILLTIKDDNDEFRSETIIGKKESVYLIEMLTKLLNDPILSKNGFKVV